MMMSGDLLLLLEHVEAEISRIDTTQIAVIGASIGSSVGTQFAARSPNTKALVLLSPGLRYQGITTDGPLADYHKRPVLLLVGNQDDYSYASAVKLEKVAHGPVKLIEFDSDKHGTDLFTERLGADSLIVNWLATYLE
jgi:dienelactone hydrolase